VPPEARTAPSPLVAADDPHVPAAPHRAKLTGRGVVDRLRNAYVLFGRGTRYSPLVPKPSVYLETTVVSYLVGRLSRDSALVSSNQELTREWWARRRHDFELFASGVVVDEVSKGMHDLANQRMAHLREVTLLEVTPEARQLAERLVREAAVPQKAEIDALHISVAAVNGMTYLASWNCTHIVNAITLPRVYEICRLNGYEPPFVCTPQELMGDLASD
jgi:hypothetical protein